MSRNPLTELQNLLGGKKAEDKIVTVVSYDPKTGKLQVKDKGRISNIVSSTAYSPGDQLIMNGNNIVGLSEPLSNTVWLD